VTRWYRRSDLARHAAVLAAVVAAASLAVTAWGTYKSAQVADDQLIKSREDSAKEGRAYAVRVTWWGEHDLTVVANRSLDPVRMSTYLRDKAQRGTDKVTYVHFGVIPPCSAVSVPNSLLSATASKLSRPPNEDWAMQGLHFDTVDGKSWVRSGSGRLVEASPPPLPPPHMRKGIILDKQATVKALSECGSKVL
jgi:hypothetical protein